MHFCKFKIAPAAIFSFVLMIASVCIAQEIDRDEHERVVGMLDMLEYQLGMEPEIRSRYELTDGQSAVLQHAFDKIKTLYEMRPADETMQERKRRMAMVLAIGKDFEASLSANQRKLITRAYYSSQTKLKNRMFAISHPYVVRKLKLSNDQQQSIEKLIDQHDDELNAELESVQTEIESILEKHREYALRLLTPKQQKIYRERFLPTREPNELQTGTKYNEDEASFEYHRVRWISNTFQNKTFQKKFELTKDQGPKIREVFSEILTAQKEIKKNDISEENAERVEAFRSIIVEQGKVLDNVFLPHQVNAINYHYHMTFVKEKSFFGLTDSFVIERVKITKEQQKELAELAESSKQEIENEVKPLRAKIVETKVKYRKDLLAVLTPEQCASFLEKFGHIISEPRK